VHLDGNYHRQTFATVFAGNCDFVVFEQVVGRSVIIDCASKRRVETCCVSAAVTVADIVREAEHQFIVSGVPLQGAFDRNIVTRSTEGNNIFVHGCLVAVDIFAERNQAAFVYEFLTFFYALIFYNDCQSGIEKCQFTHTLRDDVVRKLDVFECVG